MKENSKLHPVIAKPLSIINKMMDRIIGVIGAFIFAQIPQFIAQYIQRLGGHVDELKRVVLQYSKSAQAAGMSLDNYIQKMISSSFKSTGEMMLKNKERLESLTQSIQDLTTATPYTKLFLFIKSVFIDFDIVKAVKKNFTPGIPATWEGVIYAIIGIFFALFLYYTIKKALQKLFKLIINKIRKKKTPKTQTPVSFDDQQFNNDFDFKGPY